MHDSAEGNDPSEETGVPITDLTAHAIHSTTQNFPPPSGVSLSGKTTHKKGHKAFTDLEKFAFTLEAHLKQGIRVHAFDGQDQPFLGLSHIVETIEDGGEIPVDLRKKLKRFNMKDMLPLLIQKEVEVTHPRTRKRVTRDIVVVAMRGTDPNTARVKSPMMYEMLLTETIFPGVQPELPKLKPYRYQFLVVDSPTFDELSKLVFNKEARLQTLERLDPESTAKDALAQFFRSAVLSNASDIHIEPSGTGDYRIRLRVDGVLQDRYQLPTETTTKLIAQLKNRAKMKLEEKRRPQDGRVNFTEEEITIESSLKGMSARLSIIPTTGGEKAVMRMLKDSEQSDFQLEKLGLRPFVYQEVQRLIKNPHGIILVTGPTGSGKTTTLYSILQQLNNGERNICTAEDPVEVSLKGVTQVQIHKAIDLGFPEILRSFLRQDPDIILVGEIRDEETAEIATQAALTGHLVFATVHANDSFGTIQRLKSLGIDNSKIQNTLKGVLSQRLVRSLCTECKEEYDAKDELNAALKSKDEASLPFTEPVMLHRSTGLDENGAPCSCCEGSGYSGRLPITEIWTPTPEERDLLMSDEIKLEQLYQHARKRGMIPMMTHALEDIKSGRTSFTECLARAFSADELHFRRGEIIPFLRGNISAPL